MNWKLKYFFLVPIVALLLAILALFLLSLGPSEEPFQYIMF